MQINLRAYRAAQSWLKRPFFCKAILSRFCVCILVIPYHFSKKKTPRKLPSEGCILCKLLLLFIYACSEDFNIFRPHQMPERYQVKW